MDDATFMNWVAEFKAKHGYDPDKDPDLLGKGYSAEQSLQEHMDALKYGQEFMEMNGRAPTEHDYRYQWFNGFTPENEGVPDWYTPPVIPPAPKPTKPFSTAGFGGYLKNRVPPSPFSNGGGYY
jgi:hypothetical protein